MNVRGIKSMKTAGPAPQGVIYRILQPTVMMSMVMVIGVLLRILFKN